MSGSAAKQQTQIGWTTIVLMSVCSLGSISAAAQTGVKPESVSTVGPVQLSRVYHTQSLVPDREHAGFSSLLYDATGDLVLHEGNKTWLYTTGLFEAPTGVQRDWYGKWISHVREFNVETLVSGEKKFVLGLADGDQWAVIHDVVKVKDDLYVAFYSTNGGIRAAIGATPDGLFTADPNFKMAVTEPWEKQGGEKQSLESNGAHVLIEDGDQFLTLWEGYDSYHVDKTTGQLGWAKVRIDKTARKVELVGKDPDSPLPLLPENYIAARSGGNLATSIRLGGEHAYFYYTRPSKEQIFLTAALSTDPLFHKVDNTVQFESPLDNEKVIEKFASFMFKDELHIIYENQLQSGHWGTGLRIYIISLDCLMEALRLKKPGQRRNEVLTTTASRTAPPPSRDRSRFTCLPPAGHGGGLEHLAGGQRCRAEHVFSDFARRD